MQANKPSKRLDWRKLENDNDRKYLALGFSPVGDNFNSEICISYDEGVKRNNNSDEARPKCSFVKIRKRNKRTETGAFDARYPTE